MTMDVAVRRVGRIEKVRAEILRLLERHMASGAILHGLVRVIKAPRAVTGHAAQKVTVIVVLTTKELFVMVQFLRNTHFVAGGAELSGSHERFEKRLLVEFR